VGCAGGPEKKSPKSSKLALFAVAPDVFDKDGKVVAMGLTGWEALVTGEVMKSLNSSSSVMVGWDGCTAKGIGVCERLPEAGLGADGGGGSNAGRDEDLLEREEEGRELDMSADGLEPIGTTNDSGIFGGGTGGGGDAVEVGSKLKKSSKELCDGTLLEVFAGAADM